jgi:hypothetical protein
MANQFVWVDIPVLNIDRAIAFYSAVLDAPVSKQEYPGFMLGLLPGAGGEVSGCLYVSETDKPSDAGPLIYLNCSGRLAEAAAAVTATGGTIIQDVHQIGPHGYRAVVKDTEGNRIALHSM